MTTYAFLGWVHSLVVNIGWFFIAFFGLRATLVLISAADEVLQDHQRKKRYAAEAKARRVEREKHAAYYDGNPAFTSPGHPYGEDYLP